MTLEAQVESGDNPLPSNGSEPLVPILRVDEGKVDPVALATWHEALSNTLSVEVPHDLMGLWLYPTQGGAVLLGPEGLAKDDLVIPVPAPYLKPEQLSLLEEIIVDAGYRSATCLPVRFGKRDVGLLLVADLQPERYGPVERVVLQCVAQRVGPMLGRIARQWIPEAGPTSRQQERIAGLLETVARANREGTTPQRFIAAISDGLAPLLPHEHIELLVQSESGEQYFRMGEHPGGPLWADPSLVIQRGHLDVAAIFGGRTRLFVSDIYEDDRWPRGFLTAVEPAGADIRAVAGARLNLKGKSSAYLLVGSIGPDIYGDEDVELLTLLAGLILPQIAEFLRVPEPPATVPGAKPIPAGGSAEVLLKIAGALATMTEPAAATRLIAIEGASVLPFETMVLVLKLTDSGRMVVLRPGERRAALMSRAGTTLADVLSGGLPYAVGETSGQSRLVVPLRVAGRVQGALLFTAPLTCAWNEGHVQGAQGLADIVAARLDLLRRSAFRAPPYVPGWKRTEKSS
jgi:GAF domain-containing protein